MKQRHGKSYTKSYRAWLDAKSRCFNVLNSQYCRYGAVGITMDPELVNNPELWCSILGEPPITKELPARYWSVDRIDPRLNYSINNIKWSTSKDQVQNRKIGKNNSTGFHGICINVDKNGKTRFHVYWSEKGKSFGKSFNASKLGLMPATKAALEFRHLKLLELNSRGENYTEFHGKDKYEI